MCFFQKSEIIFKKIQFSSQKIHQEEALFKSYPFMLAIMKKNGRITPKNWKSKKGKCSTGCLITSRRSRGYHDAFLIEAQLKFKGKLHGNWKLIKSFASYQVFQKETDFENTLECRKKRGIKKRCPLISNVLRDLFRKKDKIRCARHH